MKAHSTNTIAAMAWSLLAAGSLMIAGCAGDGSSSILPGSFTTGSIDQGTAASAVASKSNPVCLTLASQIDVLNKEGIPDKVSKAAAKKYKLKASDIAKADELNRANNEFQAKCSEYPPAPTVAAAEPEKPAAAASGAAKPAGTHVAAKSQKPPVPSQKPSAQAAAAPAPAEPSAVPAGAVAESAAVPSAGY
jgi:hypothetical protein